MCIILHSFLRPNVDPAALSFAQNAVCVNVIPGRFQQKSSFSTSAVSKPPCVAKKGNVVEVHDSIRFTQRSKSFKRSIPGYLSTFVVIVYH